MTITQADLNLLSEFVSIAEAGGWKYVLIGASARIVQMDIAFDLRGDRTTQDWDFAIKLTNWDEFEQIRAALVASGWFQFATAQPHRLRHRDGGSLDLVPYGDIAGTEHLLRWPDGNTMSVAGFDECALQADLATLPNGVRVHVGSIASLALLKLLAYIDRRREGITKDITDLYWFALHYEEAGNQERVFDEARDAILGNELLTEDAGAWLLGRDVGANHESSTLAPVRDLLRELELDSPRLIEDLIRNRRSDSDATAIITRKLVAFRDGLRAATR